MTTNGMRALIGMPRSGTTWVAKAIDSHPDTYYMHEPDSVRRMQFPHIIAKVEAPSYVEKMRQYLDHIEEVRELKVTGRLPFYPKSYQPGWHRQWNQLSVTGGKVLGKFLPGLITKAPLMIKPKQPYVPFWKSIESMGRVSVLAKVDPSMRILLLVRHPCAVINSELKGEAANQFASKTPIYENWGLFEHLLKTPTAIKAGLTIEQLKQLSPAKRLAWRWRIYYEQLLDNAQEPTVHLVRYESLCKDPMLEFPTALEFLGLTFHSQVEQYLQASTSSHSDSYYATFKNPQKAMLSWKAKMSPDDIDAIESIVGEYLSHEHWAL